jgi:hypothetical protein
METKINFAMKSLFARIAVPLCGLLIPTLFFKIYGKKSWAFKPIKTMRDDERMMFY